MNESVLLDIQTQLTDSQIIEFAYEYGIDYDRAKVGLSEYIYYSRMTMIMEE